MEDAGAYKCLTRNILGEDEKTAILVVQSRSKYSILCPHDSYASEVEKNCLLLMFFLGQLEGYKILGFDST